MGDFHDTNSIVICADLAPCKYATEGMFHTLQIQKYITMFKYIQDKQILTNGSCYIILINRVTESNKDRRGPREYYKLSKKYTDIEMT